MGVSKRILNLRKISRWDVVQRDVISIVRTNLTQNLGFVVVSPIPKSGFSIWVVKRPESTNFLSAFILSLTNMNNFLPKLLKPLEFVVTSTWRNIPPRINFTFVFEF